jgi:hypothetical protein
MPWIFLVLTSELNKSCCALPDCEENTSFFVSTFTSTPSHKQLELKDLSLKQKPMQSMGFSCSSSNEQLLKLHYVQIQGKAMSCL